MVNRNEASAFYEAQRQQILSNGSRVSGIGSMAATACEAVIGSIPMPTASKNSAYLPSGMPEPVYRDAP